MNREEKALAVWIILFFGFLIGYLFGMFMCKKMQERIGIVPKETECSCCCAYQITDCTDKERVGCEDGVLEWLKQEAEVTE